MGYAAGLAMGVYRAAHELDLDIPRGLSVVGFDGLDFCELLGPPLTTVDVFPELPGEKAAELLVQAINHGAGRECVTEWVEPQFVERASVRRI